MAGGMKVAVSSAVDAGPWGGGTGCGGTVKLLLLLSGCLVCGSAEIGVQVVMLQESRVYNMIARQQFCYENVLIPKWHDIWTRIQIRVNSSKLVRVTQAENEEKLKELEQFSVWNFFSSFLKEKLNDTYVNLGLYSTKTCLKVEITEEDTKYSVTVTRRFDPKLFLVFLLGLMLFFCGDLLSRSQIFYYSTGMSVGIVASLLIIIFILSKFMPKKSPIYIILVGGWSFSLYLIQLVFKNLQEIWRCYWQYLLISRYHMLPLPLSSLHCVLRTWSTLFGGCTSPTEEEYRIQGEVETRKALEELREYCNSPDCSAWKTISRIQSPKRFADFVEGSFHLTPNEVSVHEQEYGLGSIIAQDEIYEETSSEEEGSDSRYPTVMQNNFLT
ncbi:PREDICTED: nuclear envelope integral membrane protein 1 isoform X2 [Miniopterus natalensis]|uniref:nuclear envelope integral membrane protein 1 isoform X2 n=1 Tax=Miniopterus natalensis TaxID=291302 RepID=UPI0007A6E08C|nr:PREDICTED: nuclear envelope integral membrane protein 1 isoform X2 [Miniopterus natalensis]